MVQPTLSWSTLRVEVEVDANVLRASLVIQTVASALREVSYQQVAVQPGLEPRLTHKAEGLVEF